MNPLLLPKVRSDAIMDACGLMECALRISSLYPGHRCSGRDTVVGAHLPVIGKGVATKVTDLAVAAGCFNCHEILDGRDKKRSDYIHEKYPTAVVMRMLNGLVETQAQLVEMGIIVVPDDRS